MMLSTLLISYVAATSSRRLRGVSLDTLQEPGCTTVSGPDQQATAGGNCSFPFQFRNTTYYGCTTTADPDGLQWCSTETDDDGLHQQGNWGYCNPACTHLVADISGNDEAAPGCCTCEDDPGVAANGGNCTALETYFGCETDVNILRPVAPPGTRVRDICPSTCGQKCCPCPDDDDQVFINPITNAPTASPARTLSIWAPAPAPACADAYWCAGWKSYCWHSWISWSCPNTCSPCQQPSYQLDDSLPILRSTNLATARRVEDYHPVFYFDSNSCFPDYAIDRQAQPNPGLDDLSLTAGCRNDNFMDRANTYHRWTSKIANGHTYQVHLYDLYFQKDQVLFGEGWGHKHDVETVIMYFTDGNPTHVAVSSHGTYEDTRAWSATPGLPHPQIVYRSEFWNTHSLRFRYIGRVRTPTGRFPSSCRLGSHARRSRVLHPTPTKGCRIHIR